MAIKIRKAIAAFALAAGLMAGSVCSAANWYWLASNDSYSTYIDLDSVQRLQVKPDKGEMFYYASVWEKFEYPSGRFNLEHMKISKNRMMTIDLHYEYNCYGTEIGSVTYPEKWERVVPGTVADTIWHMIY